MQTAISCHFMRGGTSRGPFFAESDLPADTALTLKPGDKVLMSRFGQFSLLWVDMAERLEGLPEVETATLDWVAFPAVVPADPMHSLHWGHNNTAQMLSYNWTTTTTRPDRRSARSGSTPTRTRRGTAPRVTARARS